MNRLILLLVICLLTGCGVSIKQPPRVADEFMVPCRVPGPLVAGDHVTVEVWAINTATIALECAKRHEPLVASVRRRDALYD